MRKEIALFSVVILILPTNGVISHMRVDNTIRDTNKIINAVSTVREQNITVNLNFIGFTVGLFDEKELLSYLPSRFERFNQPSDPHSILNILYNVSYLSEQDAENIKSFILAHGINGTGTGYMINTTLLQQELISGQRSNIFIPVNGISINVDLVHQYIYENYYKNVENIPAYTLYLLNMSELDNPTNNLDHYYTKEIVNFDTNKTVDYWYSGYNNVPLLQPLGWGGKYRFAFVDLSARTWYFDWVKTAWTQLPDTNPTTLYFQYPDFDSLARAYDFSTSEGKQKLLLYLQQWIRSYVGNVFSAYYYRNPIGESYSLQVLVLDNLTNNGYGYSDINWIISKARIENTLKEVIPWIDWRIEVKFAPLSNYPEIENYIKEHVYQDQNGYYVETSDGLLALLESLLPNYFNLSAADTVLPCYAFLLNNLTLKYMGISFAGLGGMGWELLANDQYSLFENGDNTKPRRGLSATLIHELGHSLGYPHPHSIDYSWGSEFIDEVMSYFPLGVNSYSQFYIDGIGRSHGDYFIYNAKKAYEELYNKYVEVGKPDEYSKAMGTISLMIQNSDEAYFNWNYNQSITLARTAKKAAEDLYQQISGISTTHPTSSSNNSNTSNFWSDYGWIIGVGIAVLLIPPIFLAIRVIVKKKV